MESSFPSALALRNLRRDRHSFTAPSYSSGRFARINRTKVVSLPLSYVSCLSLGHMSNRYSRSFSKAFSLSSMLQRGGKNSPLEFGIPAR